MVVKKKVFLKPVKEELNKKQLGLTVAIFCAGLHALWALMVAIGVGQAYLDWIFPLHFIDKAYSAMAFSLGTALALVVMAFAGGYVFGWLFAALWNWVGKK